MLAVAAFWENKRWVSETPRAVKGKLRLWTFTMKAFGVSRLTLIDVDAAKPECNDAEISFELRDSLKAVLDAHVGAKVVFLSQAELIPSRIECTDLAKFQHPTGDVLYVVGSDYGQLNFDALSQGGYLEGSYIVSIETPANVPLWSHVALAIALYDRHMKQE